MANALSRIEGTEGQVLANLERYADEADGAFAANTVRALRSNIAIFTDASGSRRLVQSGLDCVDELVNRT